MSKRHARMAPPPRKVLAELPADCFEGKNEKRSKQPREKTHWQMKRNSSAVKYLGGHHDPQTEKREQKEQKEQEERRRRSRRRRRRTRTRTKNKNNDNKTAKQEQQNKTKKRTRTREQDQKNKKNNTPHPQRPGWPERWNYAESG